MSACSPLAIAESALSAILDDGADAERELKRALRANRQLDGEGRALVADVVLGVSCLHGRLRFQLAQASYGVDGRHLAALYLLDEHERAGSVDVSRAALRDTTFPAEPVARLAAFRSLPTWLARRFVDERGAAEADALAAALNRRGPITARVNPLTTTRAELRRALAEEGVESREGHLSPWALHLEGRPNIRGSRAWRDGWFEVQDEGSQMLALATNASPGDVVIDLCAGRGGKSLALAAMVENDGRVVAFDVDERRLDDLLPRKARAGATCIEVVRDASALPRGADVVLVDAPCSETGALRRGPHKRWLLDEREVDRMPALQLEILAHAASLVRPGGRIVYATCSVLRAENESLVERFVSRDARFAQVTSAEWLPHVDGTDGFYAATLCRA